jgi:Xaa-Pro dipeptidase
MASRLAEFYPEHLQTVRERFDAALSETGFEAVVIYSGALRMKFLDDNPYPFATNPHFKSWVPLVSDPECFVVYAPGSRPEVMFHQPVDYWHKPPETPRGFWVDHVSLHIVSDGDQARERISNLLGNSKKVAFIGEWQERFDDWLPAEKNPHELLEFVHYERARKTRYEIECIREANRIAVRGHIAAREGFAAGASEFEIHLAYLEATGQNEAELPYGNIIALNENGAVLHYQLQRRERPAPGERHAFLIDAGATVHGYASDITRTWAASPGEFQELIDRMDEAEQGLVGEVRPGVWYPDLHLSAHHRIAKILEEMGFVRMDAESMVESGVSAKFFPHGVGHYLGLQVHDVGGFSADPSGRQIPKPEGHPFLRLTRTVEEGHVFTIEPGLYFIDSLLEELQRGPHSDAANWDRIDSFRKYGGVRIEDNIVVTAEGSENLTREQFES